MNGSAVNDANDRRRRVIRMSVVDTVRHQRNQDQRNQRNELLEMSDDSLDDFDGSSKSDYQRKFVRKVLDESDSDMENLPRRQLQLNSNKIHQGYR